MADHASSAAFPRYLVFALPGVFVAALAISLFESSTNLTAHDFTHVIDDLLAPTQRHLAKPPVTTTLAPSASTDRKSLVIRPAVLTLAEVKARYIWLSTVMLNLVMTGYVTVNCGLLIYRRSPRRQLILLIAVGAVLAAVGLSFLATRGEDDVLYRAVYGFTYQSLGRSGQIHDDLLRFIKMTVSTTNVLAVLAPIVAVLALCSVAGPAGEKERLSPDFLVDRMRQLNEVLYGGSAILVTGILHMGAWLRWPASLVADRPSHEAVLGVALAITIFWGTTFTLMLSVSYVPAAVYLARHAQAALRSGHYSGTIADPERWLKEHGFYLSLEQYLVQFGVLLAPVLASPIGSFLFAPLNLIES